MILENAKVLWNKKLGPSYYKVGLQCWNSHLDVVPGQFVMIRIPGQMDPLLRRPFSIHQTLIDNGVVKGLEVLYQVVGKGTARLSKVKRNDLVDILGPLGKGFMIPRSARMVFVVAGGIGIAPLFYLISNLEKTRHDMHRPVVFLGGRSKRDILCLEELSKKGLNIHVTTDDGTYGKMGLVTDLLEKRLEKQLPDMICACGPSAMLKKVAVLSEKYNTRCQISLETTMACGMGACLGCAVKIGNGKEKYAHACVDGPVFDLDRFRL